MVYNISEVFYSIQGEGLLQGLPMVFLRLSGCNLKCPFCDTKYALENGREVDTAEILKITGRYGCKRVCITGGEPFLQNLSSVVKCLKEKKYWVAAETNGTLWQKLPLDWLTVSPKKEGRGLFPEGYDGRFAKAASEFKYVITCKEDMRLIDKRVEKPLILQPVNNDLSIALAIIKFLERHPQNNWYLRFQNHKIAGVK